MKATSLIGSELPDELQRDHRFMPGRCPECRAPLTLWMIHKPWVWRDALLPFKPHACPRKSKAA